MSNLIFSLNATVPVFLLIILGALFKKWKLVNEGFCKVCDRLVFKVTLPIMLFLNMSETDILHQFDLKFVMFCAGATTIIFFTIWGLARAFLKDRSLIAEFTQAAYRSSAAVLGCAFIENIYGTTGMAPLMILGSVPLFNIYAVIVLTLESDGERQESGRAHIKKALVNIIKNPIIIGILAGFLASLINLRLPGMVDKTLSYLSNLTTPLALISIGASFQGKKALAKIRPSLVAALVKLVVLTGIFLPAAISLGFRDQKLVAILIMLGSPTTPSSYVMTRNMGHEGVLTASVIAMTTILSAITLTFWICLMNYLGYIAG